MNLLRMYIRRRGQEAWASKGVSTTSFDLWGTRRPKLTFRPYDARSYIDDLEERCQLLEQLVLRVRFPRFRYLGVARPRAY